MSDPLAIKAKAAFPAGRLSNFAAHRFVLDDVTCASMEGFLQGLKTADPVEQARAYDVAGADELMFLDITASSDGRAATYEIIARTAEACFMPLSVGGGVRSVDDARRLLRSGADKVAVNTAAVENPDLIAACADAFGAQCVVAA